MSRPAPTSRTVRALRGGLVALVLAGYLAALGTTASGAGLKLIPHLALHHAPTALVAPQLVGDVEGDRDVLMTLRPGAHHHDGHAHHGHDGHRAAPHAPRTVRVMATSPEARGVHTHDGVLHSHNAPPREARVWTTVSLDRHRLPAAHAVPVPPVSPHAVVGVPDRAPPSVIRLVETPPPIGRG